MSPKAWGLDFDLFFGGEEEAPFEELGDYAVVAVNGPLTKAPGWWGASYEEIGERARAAFESSAAKVCLRIDSPGGDLAGCFELASDLRSLAASTGKPLLAFTDGDCCSGAYALASAADEIVGTPQSFLGSVGVWAALVDMTEADARWGAKIVIASSGEHKADWNPHVPMTEAAFNRLQEQVVAQAELFFALVAGHRAQTNVDQLRALKGASPFGQSALSAGLCDRLVSSWSAFLAGEESNVMPPKSSASKYDEAIGALRAAAEEESEDGKKAKKALKAIDGDGDDEKKEKEEKEKAAKAAADEEEKKKDEQAKALAASNLELAREVQALKAESAERARREQANDVAAKRAVLFAKRPDFSPAVRAALEHVPLDTLEKAVAEFPRVSADPAAAAAAATPVVSGEGDPKPKFVPTLSADEQRALDLSDPGRREQVSTRAQQIGTQLQMPKRTPTPEEAAKRVAELDEQLKKEAI